MLAAIQITDLPEDVQNPPAVSLHRVMASLPKCKTSTLHHAPFDFAASHEDVWGPKVVHHGSSRQGIFLSLPQKS